jgi:hypothetical protein
MSPDEQTPTPGEALLALPTPENRWSPRDDEYATEPGELLLCALLWSHDDPARVLAHTRLLRPADFFYPTHGRIFATISDLAERGAPTDTSAVLEDLRRTGDLTGHKGRQLADALAAATVAGADPHSVSDHALEMVLGAFRRGYRSAGHAMLAAADSYTSTELDHHFAALVRSHAAARQRIAAIATALHQANPLEDT